MLLWQGAAGAQAKSPAGDKGGAKALSGKIVQYEEYGGRAILYHDAIGGLADSAPPSPVENVKPAPARSSATKAAPPPAPRAPQREAGPAAEGVALRR